MVEALAHEVPHAERDGVRSEADVAISEEQKLPRRRVRTPLGGVVLAEPAVRQLLHVDHREPGVLAGQPLGDLAGAVLGAVVHEQDLEVRVAEGEQRPERLLDRRFLVPGRHDHGETGRRGLVGAGRRHLIEPAHLEFAVDDGPRDSRPHDEREDREREEKRHRLSPSGE